MFPVDHNNYYSAVFFLISYCATFFILATSPAGLFAGLRAEVIAIKAAHPLDLATPAHGMAQEIRPGEEVVN